MFGLGGEGGARHIAVAAYIPMQEPEAVLPRPELLPQYLPVYDTVG